jgi:hypothetical protein
MVQLTSLLSTLHSVAISPLQFISRQNEADVNPLAQLHVCSCTSQTPWS